MKNLLLVFSFISVLSWGQDSTVSIDNKTGTGLEPVALQIIPRPNYYKISSGEFELKEGMKISCSQSELDRLADYVIQTLHDDAGITIAVAPKLKSANLKLVLASTDPELDVKIDTLLNSGIQCRGQVWEKDTTTAYVAGDAQGTVHHPLWKAGYIWGYQIEIDPSDRAWTDGLYEPGNMGWIVTLKENEVARKAFKKHDWNHFKIVMNGNHIQAWVNGVQTLDMEDDMSASGFIGLHFHGAGRTEQENMKTGN